MKATGIVRNVDDLGRVCLPKELRRTLGIEDHDPIEVFVEDDFILLRKYQPSCYFCGESKDVFQFREKTICRACASEIGVNSKKLKVV